MSRFLSPLTSLILELGRQGGAVTGSVYDTAQSLRWNPPSDPQPVLSWLLGQQWADGGWGDPAVAYCRDVPTLAAVLALHALDPRRYATQIQAGLAIVRDNAEQWSNPHPAHLPVAVEWILPRLLDEAAAHGLLPSTPAYQTLRSLGTTRRQHLARRGAVAGNTASHSWEAWGTWPDHALIDSTGGIGHSPAAVSYWYALGGADSDERAAAGLQRYLRGAADATGAGVEGVFPVVWPITRFEQAFGLYGLAVSGGLTVPAIHEVAEPIVRSLARQLAAGGVGMSDAFHVDGDTSAAAWTVVHAVGVTPPPHVLQPYMEHGAFAAYPGELQPSLSVACRLLHANSADQASIQDGIAWVLAQQYADGRWPEDKWNASWLYSAWHALLACQGQSSEPAVQSMVGKTLTAMEDAQYADGGWGARSVSRGPDTTFAIFALIAARSFPGVADRTLMPLRRAFAWLSHAVEQDAWPTTWVGKELYTPVRVDRALAYSALFAAERIMENL